MECIQCGSAGLALLFGRLSTTSFNYVCIEATRRTMFCFCWCGCTESLTAYSDNFSGRPLIVRTISLQAIAVDRRSMSLPSGNPLQASAVNRRPMSLPHCGQPQINVIRSILQVLSHTPAAFRHGPWHQSQDRHGPDPVGGDSWRQLAQMC